MFKLFSKVSADGSDRQNAHKTSKFKNAAVVHNIVQILLYILFMTELVIVHAFCRLLIFAQNIFFGNNSFKHNIMYPNVEQFVP